MTYKPTAAFAMWLYRIVGVLTANAVSVPA
jgi:hypothetical protein